VIQTFGDNSGYEGRPVMWVMGHHVVLTGSALVQKVGWECLVDHPRSAKSFWAEVSEYFPPLRVTRGRIHRGRRVAQKENRTQSPLGCGTAPSMQFFHEKSNTPG